MADQIKSISTVGIVLFIAAGLVVFITVFILAKRQITRFSFRQSRHPISAGAPLVLKREIREKIARVPKIKHEPVLLTPKILQNATSAPNHYLYRMKAVDAFAKFDDVLKSEEPTAYGRHPTQSVRQYLMGLCPSHLSDTSYTVIQQFADAYNHARHDPAEFGENQYSNYIRLLEELIVSLKTGIRKQSGASPSQSPTLDTTVVFEPNKNKHKTKLTSPDGDSEKKSKRNVPSDLRFRSRQGSSGHSSLLDSGHSSQPSSELTDRDGSEKILLVDMGGSGRDSFI